MKSLVGQTRMSKKKLNITWLDLRNAFGSIPHLAIKRTLEHIGFPDDMIKLLRNVYTNATTQILTDEGHKDPIHIESGVKQGCTMSQIVFNLCIKVIMRMVKDAAATLKSGACNHFSTEISCLAYADDLVLIARSGEALRELLFAAGEAAFILGLQFRPHKCATFTMTSPRNCATFVDPQDYTIQR